MTSYKVSFEFEGERYNLKVLLMFGATELTAHKCNEHYTLTPNEECTGMWFLYYYGSKDGHRFDVEVMADSRGDALKGNIDVHIYHEDEDWWEYIDHKDLRVKVG